MPSALIKNKTKALVGYTGFVGSNLYENGCFDRCFNSKNIEEAYGLCPELLVYAGMRAEKYLANNAPEKDVELVYQAEENIRKIQPKKLVLISTIDIYKTPIGVDENSEIETKNLHAYGLNRYYLECWVRENYPDALIVRLPGLFGKNIKKNFIYDYINIIPFMLKAEKFNVLSEQQPLLKKYYTLQSNGFYKCGVLTKQERKILKECFHGLGFTALHFTDSRSVYQFYPLNRLWDDITVALDNGICLFNPATEPISAGELFKYLTGREFVNELEGAPAKYDYRTVYASFFGGEGGYIANKETILSEIRDFITLEKEREQ